jgi:hypothetical protein
MLKDARLGIGDLDINVGDLASKISRGQGWKPFGSLLVGRRMWAAPARPTRTWLRDNANAARKRPMPGAG